jgi:hypothetical protein
MSSKAALAQAKELFSRQDYNGVVSVLNEARFACKRGLCFDSRRVTGFEARLDQLQAVGLSWSCILQAGQAQGSSGRRQEAD